MKTIGLITEYNPFHNGHLHHLTKSKKDLDADFVIVLMSGSFVQRGAPAIYDKYVRTDMALKAGADLVLEMPVPFSTASAKEFAMYGISLFSALGIVDSVSFGSECGSLAQLMEIADLLQHEPEECSVKLRAYQKSGMTFPEARNKALLNFLPPKSQSILNAPNNILGIEYCRAAMELDSPVSLHTIIREGSGYHDTSMEERILSASAIRKALEENVALTGMEHSVPSPVFRYMKDETPLFLNDFSSLLNYRILQGEKEHPYSIAADMTLELAARLRKEQLSFDSFEHRVTSLKSRQLTYTRVSRALLHLLLDIREEDMACYKEQGYASYARILGFRKQAAPLLSKLKKSSSIPLITKLADVKTLLSPTALSLISKEVDASHLYACIKKEKGCVFKNEYTQPIILLL